jgi:hypothetical protein
MNLKDIPEGHCLFCGYQLVELCQAPSPGDITLCDFCGTFMIFNEELQLIRPSRFMREIIARHSGCQQTLHRLRAQSLRN